MEKINAEIIFRKILLECNGIDFTANPIKLHKAFYDLYLQNKDIMQSFEFIIRVNPYSPTLDDLIYYYQLCGILSRKNPDYIHYEISKEILQSVDNEFVFSFELKKPKSFIDIFN